MKWENDFLTFRCCYHKIIWTGKTMLSTQNLSNIFVSYLQLRWPCLEQKIINLGQQRQLYPICRVCVERLAPCFDCRLFTFIVILTYVKVVALLFLICSASLDVSADRDTAANFPTKELFLAHVMSLCEPITKALRDNNLVTRAFRSYACAIIEKSSGVKNARDYSTTTE